MKKYLLIVAVIALGVSIAACSGKKGENTNVTDETSKQEEVTTTAGSVDENDVLAQYEDLINKAIDLQDKIAEGETASADELTKLNEQITALNAELQNASDLTEEQTQKFADLAQKWVEATTKNVQQ